MWDLTFVFLVPKGMEYSLPYYHIQNQIMSPVSPPSFYIDAIGTKWEHEDTVHIDHFFGFLIFRCMPNVPGDRIHIIDFCFSWTPPMSSYYRFATLVPKVVIPFKSLSSFVDFVL